MNPEDLGLTSWEDTSWDDVLRMSKAERDALLEKHIERPKAHQLILADERALTPERWHAVLSAALREDTDLDARERETLALAVGVIEEFGAAWDAVLDSRREFLAAPSAAADAVQWARFDRMNEIKDRMCGRVVAVKSLRRGLVKRLARRLCFSNN